MAFTSYERAVDLLHEYLSERKPRPGLLLSEAIPADAAGGNKTAQLLLRRNFLDTPAEPPALVVAPLPAMPVEQPVVQVERGARKVRNRKEPQRPSVHNV